MTYRVGEFVAKQVGGGALVTGESLGQVVSLTLANLAAEDQAVSIPVLRPFLGMDKVEIEEIVLEIDTYGIVEFRPYAARCHQGSLRLGPR